MALLLMFIGIGGSFSYGQVVKERKTYLNICSFNVYLLGAIAPKYQAIREAEKDPGYTRPDSSYGIPERVRNCAEILSKGSFELIVFQEVVHGSRGDSVMADLATELNEQYGRRYKWFTSGSIGKGFRITECMGFLYDSVKVKPLTQTDEKYSLIGCEEPKNRKYVKTCWQSGDFDFTLISCHFAWNGSDHKRRLADYQKLNHILHHPLEYSHDPDVIVVGNFNRFGGDFDESANEFGIQNLQVDTRKFRVPHVEVFDPEISAMKEVEDNLRIENPQQYSTTVSNKNSVVYDMFWITEDVLEEYKMTANKWNRDFGVLVYDEPWGNAYIDGVEQLSTSETKEAYSDHRPIWMRFRINQKTED